METSTTDPESKEAENKSAPEIVRKAHGTTYDPLWYFLAIFVFFFMFWLRSELLVIRNAYFTAIPGLTLDEMKRFEWLWVAVAACIMTTVMILKLINHFFLG